MPIISTIRVRIFVVGPVIPIEIPAPERELANSKAPAREQLFTFKLEPIRRIKR